MPTNRKNIDWPNVYLDYAAGVKSIRAIAREQGLSHPSILQRASKEGWTRSVTMAEQETTTQPIITEPVGKTGSPETVNRILEDIRLGLSPSKAAFVNGVPQRTFSHWLERLDIQEAFQQAIAARAKDRHQVVAQAILERKNPDLAFKLLQADKTTAGDFQQGSSQEDKGTVSIILNMPMPGTVEPKGMRDITRED